VLLAVAAAQFVAIALWVGSRVPNYDLWTGSAGSLRSAGAPWNLLVDASWIVLGVLGAFGLLFAWSAFDASPSRGLGLLALLLAGASCAAVGVFSLVGSRLPAAGVPWATYVAVGAAGVGLLVVAFAMHRQERWRVSRAYTFASGLVVLGALVLYVLHPFSVSSPTMARLAAAVVLVWALVEGLHIALLHRFAPGLQVKVATA
jgi:hypothetical protein